MYTHIRLTNFKAFEKANAQLGPITLILGPNNAGKSSIIAAFRLLVQTIESPDFEVPLLLDGILGDFGTYKDIVYGNHRGRAFGIELDRVAQEEDGFYGKISGVASLGLEYKYRTKRREVVLKSTRLRLDGEPLITTQYSTDAERQLITRVGYRTVPPGLRGGLSELLRMYHFLPQTVGLYAARRSGEQLREFVTDNAQQILRMSTSVGGVLMNGLRGTEYLGAMRAAPSRTYLVTGERRRRVGSSGEHAASMLMLDSFRTGKRKRELSAKVGRWLKSAGIARAVQVEMISDRHYELRVSHFTTGETENIADVGFGNSQVIPVLVAGYSLSSGATLLVEEPEIHLHPRAQAELGQLFLELFQGGIQTVVETHSEHLVLRMQSFVASGHLRPEDLCVLYVHAIGDKKKVTRLRVDKRGHFIDEWPGGFFPERIEEAKRLARLRHRAQA
ncbi:MAG TPA: AAA family ATPase [Longimicrobiales bacterium]|nr:AAA family ATPase [Longimicrobiales bacterium]